MKIVSPSNPKYRDALKLRQASRKSPRTLIDGLRELSYAVRCQVQVELWFVSSRTLSEEGDAVRELTEAIGRPPLELDEALFEKLSYGDRATGAIAVAQRVQRPLSALSLPEQPLVLIAEGLEKPGNVGAIARTADAVGVDALILADSQIDVFSANAVRASMGTIFSPKVAVASTAETLAWLDQRHIKIVAAWVGASTLYCDTDLTQSIALVVGSEAHGLTSAWASHSITKVGLPMAGIADSLNVSTTAAILAYEAWRQRHAAKVGR